MADISLKFSRRHSTGEGTALIKVNAVLSLSCEAWPSAIFDRRIFRCRAMAKLVQRLILWMALLAAAGQVIEGDL